MESSQGDEVSPVTLAAVKWLCHTSCSIPPKPVGGVCGRLKYSSATLISVFLRGCCVLRQRHPDRGVIGGRGVGAAGTASPSASPPRYSVLAWGMSAPTCAAASLTSRVAVRIRCCPHPRRSRLVASHMIYSCKGWPSRRSSESTRWPWLRLGGPRYTRYWQPVARLERSGALARHVRHVLPNLPQPFASP